MLVRQNFLHTINVEHHVPHGRPDRLMETEPDLPATTQRVVITFRGGEKGATHRSVPEKKKEN